MLDKVCPVCSNVLLQKPLNMGGEQFCVSCTELAPSGDAASRDRPAQKSTTQIETGRVPVSKAKVKATVTPKMKTEVKPERELEGQPEVTGLTGSDWSNVYESVLKKAAWAGKELNKTDSVSASKELLQLIRECTETAALVKTQTE